MFALPLDSELCGDSSLYADRSMAISYSGETYQQLLDLFTAKQAVDEFGEELSKHPTKDSERYSEFLDYYDLDRVAQFAIVDD